jgi:hypothetical protein
VKKDDSDEGGSGNGIDEDAMDATMDDSDGGGAVMVLMKML